MSSFVAFTMKNHSIVSVTQQSLEQELHLRKRACRIVFQRAKEMNQRKTVCVNKNDGVDNVVDAGEDDDDGNGGAMCDDNNCVLDKNPSCILDNNKKNSQFNSVHNFSKLFYHSISEKCSFLISNCKIKGDKWNSIMVIVTILLLLCTNVTFARPNHGGNFVVIPAPDNVLPVTTSTIPLPIDSMDYVLQNKRTADIATTEIITEIATTNESSHHEVASYPIAEVEFQRVQTPFIIGIWILSASIAKIGFHKTPKLNTIFPESCLLIVIGVIIGVILLFGTHVHVSPLTPNTFFLYMLPPIILDAGYFMPNRLFFDNLGTILLMAVVGTIFNIATIGASLWACGVAGVYGVDTPLLDIFLFASLISAVDPVAVLAVFEEIHVNEILYIVVFGESLLNDAVTVVLYHMCEAYSLIGIENINVGHIVSGGANFLVVALGGTIIGIIWGFLTGLVTRFTECVRVIEPIFIFVMAYLAYLNAEIFHMSGILAITFCGITMKNYVEANISQKSHTTIKYALKMLSSSSETIIFMFLGVNTVNNHHDWNTWFIVLTIVFCSVYRCLGVWLLTAMANKFRLHKLSNVDQFVMSYGGLRGAVAFALALLINQEHVPLQPMFVTTTIAVIYFTVFLQGITIKPLVRFLNVKRAEKKKPTMNERIHERFMDHLMAGIEDIVGKTGNYNVRDKFKRFDNKFIRPLLIRDLKGAEPKIFETYSKLAMKDAMDYMRRNPSTIGQMSGTESMSALFRNYTSILGGRCATPFLNPCPSFSNLENCSRNLDMQELDYNPSKKDLTDARIHHLLAEELKPYRRHRRLSYSRHAVDDRDLTTQVNYKMHMNIRRMNDRKHHKRSKRGSSKEGLKQTHVSFPELKQNGSAKQLSHDYINEVLNETNEEPEPAFLIHNDDGDPGLTFTAKASHNENGDTSSGSIDEEKIKRLSKDSEGETIRVTTPTAIESQLPWKRDEDDADGGAVKQNEFPAWASNKEYLAYNSPSATFLGGLSKPRQVKSVIGLFRRESSGSADAGSDPTLANQICAEMRTPTGRTIDRRSASICAVAPIVETSENGSDPLGALVEETFGSGNGITTDSGRLQTALQRRSYRRASLLDLNGDSFSDDIYSKSLPDKEKWMGARGSGGGREGGVSSGIGHGTPLLPKLTPKAQLRRMQHPQTTSLLSSSSSDTDTDDYCEMRVNI